MSKSKTKKTSDPFGEHEDETKTSLMGKKGPDNDSEINFYGKRSKQKGSRNKGTS
jgi:hypothetical protein